MHSHLQVVVASFGAPASRGLGLWLSHHGLDWRYGSSEYGVDTIHNQNITRFLREDVPRGKTDLLSIDADMVPLPETDAILSEPGNLLYCGHVGRYGSRGHKGDGDFSIGCYRASADLLELMGPPWVQTIVAGGVRVHCECNFFRHRAAQEGAVARQAGIIGHEQRCILIPTNTDLGWAVAWPTDLGEID